MDRTLIVTRRERLGIGRGAERERIRVLNNSDQDIEVTLYDADPPDVKNPKGQPIIWLAHFKVHGEVNYTLEVNGIGRFYFWDGQTLESGQEWEMRELSGDPAIGRDSLPISGGRGPGS